MNILLTILTDLGPSEVKSFGQHTISFNGLLAKILRGPLHGRKIKDCVTIDIYDDWTHRIELVRCAALDLSRSLRRHDRTGGRGLRSHHGVVVQLFNGTR